MSEETVRPPRTFYEAVGGEETFTRLVHRFYQEVAADPMLRALARIDSLEEVVERVCQAEGGAGKPRSRPARQLPEELVSTGA